METTATLVTLVLFLSFVVQSVVEYFFGPWLKAERIRYVAAVVGVLVTIMFRVDIFKAFYNLDAIVPYFGMFCTGVLVSMGSSYMNDLVKSYIITGGRAASSIEEGLKPVAGVALRAIAIGDKLQPQDFRWESLVRKPLAPKPQDFRWE